MSQGQGRITAKIQWVLIEVRAVIPTEEAIHQRQFCNGLILIRCSIWENTGAIPEGKKANFLSAPFNSTMTIRFKAWKVNDTREA